MNNKLFVWTFVFVLLASSIFAYGTNPTNATFSRTTTQSNWAAGVQMTAKTDGIIINVTKNSGVLNKTAEPVRAYVYLSGHNVSLGNATFLAGSNTAYFPAAGINITNGSNYLVMIGVLGSNSLDNVDSDASGPTFPQNGAPDLNFLKRVYCTLSYSNGNCTVAGYDTANWQNVESVGVDPRPSAPAAPSFEPSISFEGQTPSDLNVVTLFMTNVNASYKANSTLTNILLNYTLTGGLTCMQYVNGTCTLLNNTFRTKTQTSNTTANGFTNFTFSFNENDLYPSTTNLNYTNMNTYKILYSPLNTNNILLDTQYNVSNAVYNVLEVMANTTGVIRVYACNNSYTTGVITTDVNCQEIGSIDKPGYNHSHSLNSSHNIIPFTIVGGKIGGTGIAVTNRMYFGYKQITGQANLYYTSINAYPTVTRESNNNGLTYSNIAGTLDSHLHQYTNTEAISYRGQGTNSTNVINSSIRVDALELTQLVTAPTVTNPFNNIQSSRYLNITYTNATTIGGGNIIYYNISLLNYTGGFIKTIVANNSLNNNYYWDVYGENLTLNNYFVRVAAVDNLRQSAADRELFNLTKNALLNITGFRLITNASINNFTIQWYDISDSIYGINTTTTSSVLLDTVIGHLLTANITATNLPVTTKNKTITKSYDTLTFYDFGIVQCDANFTTTTLILKYFLEQYPSTAVNGTTEITLSAWIDSPSIALINYTTTLNNALNHTLCLVEPTGSLYSNVYIKYLTSGGFYHRYYYYAQPFNNIPQTLNLYNWNSTTETSQLSLTLRDTSTFNPTENIIIKLQRYYVGEDLYRTVQMDKSSLFGTAYFNIKERDVDYKILFYNTNNELLKESGNTRFSCTSGVCTVEVLVDLTDVPTKTITSDGSVAYNNNTRIVNFYWEDTSGDNKALQYYVIKYINNFTQVICNINSTVSNSATFTCNTTGYSGLVYSYILEGGIITNGQWIELGSVKFKDIIGKNEGNFWSFGIISTIVLIGIWNPVAAIVLLIGGTILISFLGLIDIFIASSILLAAFIIIILMGKK